ncbi:tail fiber assembly protein [Herbaspirillum sp. RU 5E]|nr:tail fiber assembly protein [Herbaspirillum sp. RU 5E]
MTMNAPEFWNFHPATRALIRTAEPCYADPDPLVEGNWLFPGNTTDAKPGPDVEGKYQVIDLDAQEWSYVDLPTSSVESAPAVGDSSPAELAAAAEFKRDMLLQVAGLRIAPLQDAVDLGVATESEQALLVRWKQYRVALGRINTQEGYPKAVAWPDTPDPLPTAESAPTAPENSAAEEPTGATE